MPLRLSVLDQSPVCQGSTGAEALRRSVDLARLVDTLGYTRYWVAEHHGTPMLAGASPEILIGAIAAATSRFRVGSGGVMLPHYSPLKVAETFSVLSALHPDRIDLGLGRAAGTDPLTAFALQRDRRQAAPDDFPQQLAELLAYLDDAWPPRPPVRAPGRASGPARTSDAVAPRLLSRQRPLGRRGRAARTRSRTSSIRPAPPIARQYRDACTRETARAVPQVIAAVSAICAETDEEAERLASSARMVFTLFHQGQFIQVPPVDTAVRFLEEHAGARDALGRRRRMVVGSPETVKRGLEAVAADYGADEIMIVTITYDHEARKRSYELSRRRSGWSDRGPERTALHPITPLPHYPITRYPLPHYPVTPLPITGCTRVRP